MNWDRVEGNWKQLTGKIKEQWGKLTEDDITAINGRRDQLEGKLQKRYGYAKDIASAVRLPMTLLQILRLLKHWRVRVRL
jgi:uncharacterized protein YjbJ (UPF0337 family)